MEGNRTRWFPCFEGHLEQTHVCWQMFVGKNTWICWKPMIVGITYWRSNLGSYKQYGRDSLFMHVIFTTSTSHCECSNKQDQKCTSLIPILGGGLGMRLRVHCLKSHCECSNKHGGLTVCTTRPNSITKYSISIGLMYYS